METKYTYRDLKVWQESMRLVKDIYQLTAQFSESEKYGLTSQMQRAAIAIPSNIAEGHSRGKGDFARFLRISLGSTTELETQILICQSLGLISNDAPLQSIDSVKRMLFGLIKKIEHPEPKLKL